MSPTLGALGSLGGSAPAWFPALVEDAFLPLSNACFSLPGHTQEPCIQEALQGLGRWASVPFLLMLPQGKGWHHRKAWDDFTLPLAPQRPGSLWRALGRSLRVHLALCRGS